MKAPLPDRPAPWTQTLSGTRVAVTGATGFIGRRLVRALLQIPDSRLTLLVRSTSRLEGLQDPRVTLRIAPLDEPDRLVDALADGVDYIFHLAGLTRARDLATYMRTNREGTVSLARAVAGEASTLRRFVHVGSLAAVGPAPDGGAVGELSQPAPRTWYGASKLASEQALAEVLSPERFVVARPPAVYGPGERDLFALFKAVQRGIAPVVGSPRKAFSFVYVDDLVEALIRLAVAPEAAGNTFFVAHSEVRTQADLVSGIASALGRRPVRLPIPHAAIAVPAALGTLAQRFLRRPPLLTMQRLREITPRRWVCDPSRMERALGWSCPTDLAKGLELAVHWYRQNGWL